MTIVTWHEIESEIRVDIKLKVFCPIKTLEKAWVLYIVIIVVLIYIIQRIKLIKFLLSAFVKIKNCFCCFTVFIMVPVGCCPFDVSRIIETTLLLCLRAQKVLSYGKCEPKFRLTQVKFGVDIQVFFMIYDDIRIISLKHIDKPLCCKAQCNYENQSR